MDRAEATGLGVAFAGHAALLALLSVGIATATRTPIQSEPMEVAFVDEVGLESMAPSPSNEAPAPKLADIEGPVEPESAPPLSAPVPQPPAPTPPAPKAIERPAPQPLAPKPAPRQQPAKPAAAKPAKPAAAKPATAKPPAKPAPRATGRLSGLLAGLSDSDSKSQSATPPAAKAGPAVQASLAAEIRRQLKPHWKSPSGADVELLRTKVRVRLAQDGRVLDADVVSTSGQNASNRPQVRLHQEQAIRAVRLASPFRLPAEYYDSWQEVQPVFDKRLSQ